MKPNEKPCFSLPRTKARTLSATIQVVFFWRIEKSGPVDQNAQRVPINRLY